MAISINTIKNTFSGLLNQQYDVEMALRMAVLKEVLLHYGYQWPAINSGYRSPDSQIALYNAYLDGRQALKPASQSWHVVGRAFDANFNEKTLPVAVAVWKLLGGRWGGEFSSKDPVHFDLPGSTPPPKLF